MFSNYLKTTFRNLWKHRGYSFLNIFGLSVGIACASLIFLWIEDEVTYNDYFTNQSTIYKVKDKQTYNGNTFVFDATPGPLAQGMKLEIPGIKTTARSTWTNDVLFALKDKTIYQAGNYVDPGFLSIFHLQFIKGNAATAFSQLNTLVITEKMANTFFNSTDVVGKTLKVDNNKDYVITGVIKDLPKNVSFKFQWLAPFAVFENENTWLKQWGSNSVITYAEIEANADIEHINKQLYNFVGNKVKGISAKMMLYPMKRWRLYDNFDKSGNEIKGKLKYVNLFSLIAWVVLIIACINFMNLSTARSEQRAREVGVRKVLGAARYKLICQFIGESLFMSLVSALFALFIVFVVLPWFNTLVHKQLSLNIFYPVHWGGLILIAVICGIIAGSYPAFYLSSFNPVSVLKGLKLKTSGGAVFVRKGLVVLQFTISVILIICTVIIYLQIQHTKNRDLGYNKQGLIYMQMQGKMAENFAAIKNDLLQTGVVENASISSQSVLQIGSNTGDFDWPGKDPGKQLLVTVDQASPEFISTMGAHIKAGRDFYANASVDSNNVIVNSAFAKTINAKNIIGTVITRSNVKLTIIGVITDFIYNDIYTSAAPLIIFCSPKYTSVLNIRFKAGADIKTALPQVENVIKKNNPGYPTSFRFVDAEFEQFFTEETLIGNLASIFATLAIIISCLGLFGLAAYTAERRTKEIGIRKVLGATSQGLAALLSKDFIVLVILACFVAFPISWYTMQLWLSNYEYRVSISIWVFILAGLLAIVIALATVSFQAVKTSIANPAKSLRSE
ncbi:ABC-type antimicrobial peptide transport system permease subunit [Mucilaginibacter gracilis]|uniref:ABC-type antimicrobial peptide transport system permease subunit n=1 Tax=Mucilaginibacter gracilis TaxID=423350 RepID=A0A495JAI8_9SPHI|nr:ABC transporter permease [Mucilaginibacter gracilis]RKR85731.1 ABC-type antimicrobial peptide transport system permease subunit [Mucilaginibacter gracilis]